MEHALNQNEEKLDRLNNHWLITIFVLALAFCPFWMLILL